MMKVLHFSIENDMKYDECGIMKSEERWRHLPRRFRMWVLGICTSGTMHMNIEGTEYRIIPGDYFLFPVTRLHYGTRLSDGPISYYWIHFIAPDIDDMEVSEDEGQRADSLEADEAYLMLHASLLDMGTVSSLCGQLYASGFSQYYSDNFRQCLAKALFYEISNQTLLSHAHKFDQKFTQLLQHIQENFRKPLSVEKLSTDFGYNKQYLCRIFKQRTGNTITHYYTQLRMCLACQLLSETTAPIRWIAVECGYESEKYFMRIFKQVKGMTPSQYRNSHMLMVLEESE